MSRAGVPVFIDNFGGNVIFDNCGFYTHGENAIIANNVGKLEIHNSYSESSGSSYLVEEAEEFIARNNTSVKSKNWLYKTRDLQREIKIINESIATRKLSWKTASTR